MAFVDIVHGYCFDLRENILANSALWKEKTVEVYDRKEEEAKID